MPFIVGIYDAITVDRFVSTFLWIHYKHTASRNALAGEMTVEFKWKSIEAKSIAEQILDLSGHIYGIVKCGPNQKALYRYIDIDMSGINEFFGGNVYGREHTRISESNAHLPRISCSKPFVITFEKQFSKHFQHSTKWMWKLRVI